MKIKKIAKKTPKIIPTAGYLLIEPLQAANKTLSGIYLPETTTEKPAEGKVLAVGDTEPIDCGGKRVSPAKVGDMVVYKKWGGNEVKIDGKEYIFAKFEDILGVMTK